MSGKFIQPGSVSRLLTTVRKITRPVRPKSRLGIGQKATKSPDRGGVFYTNSAKILLKTVVIVTIQ